MRKHHSSSCHLHLLVYSRLLDAETSHCLRVLVSIHTKSNFVSRYMNLHSSSYLLSHHQEPSTYSLWHLLDICRYMNSLWRLLDIRNVVCEDLSWRTRLGPTAYWRWAGHQRPLYPTWVIQCHSKTFHHPVLHDSKPYLVFRLLDTIPSRDRHVVWSLSPSKLSSRQTRPPTRRPSRGLITISAQTYMWYTHTL